MQEDVLFTTYMGRFVDNLFMSCWWYESINFKANWTVNIFIAPFPASSIKVSSNDWANRKFIVYMIHKSIEVCAKVLKFVLSLDRWSVKTGNEGLFIFQTNFGNQTITSSTKIIPSNKRNMFLIVNTNASFFWTTRMVPTLLSYIH